ncbi:hypothetical protein FHR61_001406 [Xanthomonas arboricola]|uniref:Uncharacterized protein n=1 Tax=Xanthomonas cannabis TaxID=1885674 RepID=A0ABR6JP17_9XANT|nr:hypothetical protein [Xanthomonas cannabis]MBB5521580.1 hypothetical protein [Xanthomonas cannabis]
MNLSAAVGTEGYVSGTRDPGPGTRGETKHASRACRVWDGAGSVGMQLQAQAPSHLLLLARDPGPGTRGEAKHASRACRVWDGAGSVGMQLQAQAPLHLLLLARVPGPGSRVPGFSR